MSGWANVSAPAPTQLYARRRSRCWQCDRPMKRHTRLSWWCAKCRHMVSYGVNDAAWQPLEPSKPWTEDDPWHCRFCGHFQGGLHENERCIVCSCDQIAKLSAERMGQ